MKVVILDGYLASFDGLRLPLGEEHQQIWYPLTEKEEVVQRVGDADAVITNRLRMDGEVFGRCPNLRYIGTLGTGFNMVNLEDAKAHNIVVTNCPGYSSAAVAQAVFGLLLEIVGRVSVFDRIVKDGQWKKDNEKALVAVSTQELYGKTLGVFGMGEIGRTVANIAIAFGMEVMAYRRNASQPDTGIRDVDLDTLLACSDVLSIHCPLNAHTRRLFDESVISRMKDGAILLNTARGSIVREEVVAAALDSDKLLAFGADVLAQEPPSEDNPLAKHPKAVITPHVAWMPRQTRQRLLDMVAGNYLAFLAGTPRNVVNP